MIISKNYMEVSFEGSAYEVGQKLGQIALHSPEFKGFMLQKPEFAEFIPTAAIRNIIDTLETHCPNVNREIEGMADTLSVKPEDICYYLYSYKFKGGCSHFGLSGRIMENGHTMIGRNYEYSHEMTDCIFLDIKEEGYARSMGFTSILFGKIDGMNEHGLAMTMTGGIPPVESNYADGFMFWTVIRKVLDTCKDCYEAWEVIKSMEAGYSPTYMLGDRTGTVMLVEQTPERIQNRIITEDSNEYYLAATNHFNLDQMIPLRKHYFRQSKNRYETIQNSFSNGERKYDVEDIKRILTEEYPKGLNAPYFSEYFGTLWSSIYDCRSGEAMIRMGNREDWKIYSLNKSLVEGVDVHNIQLDNRKASEDFWLKV